MKNIYKKHFRAQQNKLKKYSYETKLDKLLFELKKSEEMPAILKKKILDIIQILMYWQLIYEERCRFLSEANLDLVHNLMMEKSK